MRVTYKEVLKRAYQLSDKKVSEELFIYIGMRYFNHIREMLNDKSLPRFRMFNVLEFKPCIYSVNTYYHKLLEWESDKVELINRYKLILDNFKKKLDEKFEYRKARQSSRNWKNEFNS